ncbi:MAG: RDD family protein, partial [Thermoanaerobaculia bacterium]
GKMATHVKVLDLSESKLTGRQAFMREIVPIGLTIIQVAYELPSVLKGVNLYRPAEPQMPGLAFWLAAAASFGWFAAELITMLTNSKRRAVHDFIARSVVVRFAKPGLVVSRGTV